jgi:NTP pyrophosphatase (non-canonical NTP hydrolase)
MRGRLRLSTIITAARQPLYINMDEEDFQAIDKETDRQNRQRNIFDEIADERNRQDAKWGEQNHDLFDWMTILMEEVGELAQACLHLRYGGKKAEGLRVEAIQVAAVITAMIECIDRGSWRWDTKNS